MEPGTTSGLRRAGEELGRRILPVLFARLETARKTLERLARRIEEDPDRRLADEGLLAEVDVLGGEDRKLGWCLGVLASAAGADLLGVRREREGVRMLAELVAEGAGCTLDPPAEALPLVGTAVGEGWELPLGVAYLFLRATREKAESDVLRWKMRSSAPHRVISCPDAPPAAYRGESWTEVLAQMPGAVLVDDAESPTLALPEIWFEKEEGRGKKNERDG